MSKAQLASKVIIEEEEPKVRPITAVQTSIAAGVGVTERGPLSTATLVTSFDEYQDYFGGFTLDSELAHAVAGFFENSGQFIYIIRIVHYLDPTSETNPQPQSATATRTLQTAATGPTSGSVLGTEVEPFELSPGDTMVINVDGGGDATATFDATAAIATGTNTETFALTDGWTLQFQVNGGSLQTVTFNTAEFVDIALATAVEVAAVINAEATGISADVSGGAVRITTDLVGAGASLTGFAGTAASALGFSASASGTGDVQDIANVTAAEAKSLIEADIPGLTVTPTSGAIRISSNTTGPTSSIAVNASSTADTKFGIDNATHSGTTGAAVDTLQVDGKTPGSYANDLSILIEAATSGVADEFNLTVLDDGLIVEGPYANLSMDDTADRFVEDIINASSNLIAVIDLDAATTSQRPANGTSSNLAGGDDGLSGLVDADFGTAISAKVGLHSLDTVQDVNILIIPGQSTSVVQNGMITYCEDFRDGSMFAILDSPLGASYTEVVTYFETTASLLGLSEFGAAYWPRVKVQNPSQLVFGTVDNLTVSPAGHIAGIYARTDAARAGGVYDPPAGIEEGQIAGIVGFESDEPLDPNKRDFVFPKRINILTTFTGAPRHIDGSRCLKGNGNFPFVAQRRGAIFIEQSIKNGIEFARNKNNTPKLRRTVERTIRAFLLIQMKNEAFASQDPDLAFFVDFSDKLNDEANKIKGRVGLAFNEPAEFVIVRFSRDTRALEQALNA